MQEIQDERYYVADEAIRDAFFLLVKEKPLERITVSDIIKRAGIVRSTFYNHYDNIPMLVEEIEKKTIQDIFSFLENFRPKNDRDICASYFSTLCQYIMTNPLLAELLRNAQGNAFFVEIMNTFHHYVNEISETSHDTQMDKEKYSFSVSYAIGGAIGVLHKWTRENFHTPPEVITDILTEIFVTGLLPLMS